MTSPSSEFSPPNAESANAEAYDSTIPAQGGNDQNHQAPNPAIEASPLIQRLNQRRTQPGLISMRPLQKRYASLPNWTVQRSSLLTRLQSRQGKTTTTPTASPLVLTAPGQMITQPSPTETSTGYSTTVPSVTNAQPLATPGTSSVITSVVDSALLKASETQSTGTEPEAPSSPPKTNTDTFHIRRQVVPFPSQSEPPTTGQTISNQGLNPLSNPPFTPSKSLQKTSTENYPGQVSSALNLKSKENSQQVIRQASEQQPSPIPVRPQLSQSDLQSSQSAPQLPLLNVRPTQEKTLQRTAQPAKSISPTDTPPTQPNAKAQPKITSSQPIPPTESPTPIFRKAVSEKLSSPTLSSSRVSPAQTKQGGQDTPLLRQHSPLRSEGMGQQATTAFDQPTSRNTGSPAQATTVPTLPLTKELPPLTQGTVPSLQRQPLKTAKTQALPLATTVMQPAAPQVIARQTLQTPSVPASEDPPTEITAPILPTPPRSAGPSIEEITEQVSRRLGRQFAIERERRGEFEWRS